MCPVILFNTSYVAGINVSILYIPCVLPVMTIGAEPWALIGKYTDSMCCRSLGEMVICFFIAGIGVEPVKCREDFHYGVCHGRNVLR